VEILVLELGTDAPGDIESFSWIKPDIAVVTAVAPEHMEYFKTIDAVAKEELSVSSYSEKIIVNKDMVATEFLKLIDSDQIFNYSRYDLKHINITVRDLQVVANHSIDAVAAGIAVGKDIGMSKTELAKAAKLVKSLSGRMQILKGINKSTLIDDTYNASPEAVKAALEYLYSVKAPQRIALLGNMNELGETSKTEHQLIGSLCDPDKLDLIVTLGPDANKYISKSAKEKGCFVVESETPYEAAEIIKSKMNEGSVVLLKGSQNKVFAEEAVKLLLENKEDSYKLVRQSQFWLRVKEKCFKEVS
jgi:UDP-N-acetylmuramoyl-tripeptide--D-alanyl-D-alanine ligase